MYNHKEYQKKYQKEYQKIHQIESKNYHKEYYQNNKNKLLKYSKEYRKLHKKEIEQYRGTHKKELKELHKEWRLKHRKEIKKYYLIKRKTDMNFRILNSLRLRTWSALKGICKSKSTIKLLGCSIEHLKYHLESQFKLGMSWDNYGKWHIDHIRPCASFDLRKPIEQRKCFHYTNLQPLWAKENQIKNAQIIKDKE